MKTFVQLRQDLERVRNLCYMVSRREKLCRSFLRLREQTFQKQTLVLEGAPLSPGASAAVFAANHGPSIYDQLYSHSDAENLNCDIETLMNRIAGVESPTPKDDKKPDFNGASNKRHFFNGSISRKKTIYGTDLSSISGSETELTKDRKMKICTPKTKSKVFVKIKIKSFVSKAKRAVTECFKILRKLRLNFNFLPFMMK